MGRMSPAQRERVLQTPSEKTDFTWLLVTTIIVFLVIIAGQAFWIRYNQDPYLKHEAVMSERIRIFTKCLEDSKGEPDDISLRPETRTIRSACILDAE